MSGRGFLIVGIVAATVTMASAGWVMGAEVIVCSPVSGQLVRADGSPAAQVEVSRAWTWKNQSGVTRTTTDAQGRFSFDAAEASQGLFSRILPQEVVIEQDFRAGSGDDSRQIMLLFKRDLKMNGEWRGQPGAIVCNLDGEPSTDGSFYWGTCRPAN